MLRKKCEELLLRSKIGVGIIDYKEISNLNIENFLDKDGKYLTSNDLWKIAKSMYSDDFFFYVSLISKEFKVSHSEVYKVLRELFQHRVYEASMIEAICIWNIAKAEDYVLEPVTDEEDRKNKIDIKFRHRETQLIFNVQVKKWRKNIDHNKRASEMYSQITAYGAPALYFEVDFSETERNRRTLYIRDLDYSVHKISFNRTFGRGKDFNKSFASILDLIVTQRLATNEKHYKRKIKLNKNT